MQSSRQARHRLGLNELPLQLPTDQSDQTETDRQGDAGVGLNRRANVPPWQRNRPANRPLHQPPAAGLDGVMADVQQRFSELAVLVWVHVTQPLSVPTFVQLFSRGVDKYMSKCNFT